MADATRSPGTSPPSRRRPGRSNAGRSGGAGAASDATPSGIEPSSPLSEGEHLVLVQFKGRRKSYYHNRRGIALKVGDHCLVEADRGSDLGRVVYMGPGRPEWWGTAESQGIVQSAGAGDLVRMRENRAAEPGLWDIGLGLIRRRNLAMSLVDVERQHDGRKITFFFTAEQRVDFRELVRDLAAEFRTRIELRQIGVRDETRHKGGLGLCGREYCCAGFLPEFVPVTLKMAKTQQLPLNPAKLSGPCGRLRCCLAYEEDGYREATRRLPRVGAAVQTPNGSAVVRKIDLLSETVTVEGQQSDSWTEWPADKVQWEGSGRSSSSTSTDGCGCGGCGGRAHGGCGCGSGGRR